MRYVRTLSNLSGETGARIREKVETIVNAMTAARELASNFATAGKEVPALGEQTIGKVLEGFHQAAGGRCASGTTLL